MNEYTSLAKFLEIWNEILTSEQETLPLCAAENITSEFVSIPRGTFLQDKYILGGTMKYTQDNNFYGSSLLFKFYELINMQCAKLYKSNYSDARSFSGMSAIITLLMALFKSGDYVLITSPETGGHSSMPFVCQRLGLEFEYLPYNYESKDFDYIAINKKLSTRKVNGILIALSDMIEQPQLNRINLNETILIYDATQILGMIGAGTLANPFDWFSDEKNVILMGATHKTLPGPACGLIIMQNKGLAKSIDEIVNPRYIRNVQLDNIVSLLLSLYELEEFGFKYFQSVRQCTETVGRILKEKGVNVLTTREGDFTKTHQLWLSLPNEAECWFEKNIELSGISLNVRKRQIYNGYGVRLGFQQIARYNWNDNALKSVAEILLLAMDPKCNPKQIRQIIDTLPERKVNFTFDPKTVDVIKQKMLHYRDMQRVDLF